MRTPHRRVCRPLARASSGRWEWLAGVRKVGEHRTRTQRSPMERVEAPSTPRLRLLSATVDVPQADAAAFLRAGAGEPRGFWEHGGRWVAHRGALASVVVEPGSGAERFELVRRRARTIVHDVGADTDPVHVRFFGGFSFRGDAAADPQWRGFPSAVFHLPECLLRAGSSGVRLTVRRLVADEPGMDDRRRALEIEAAALAEALPEATPTAGNEPPASPVPCERRDGVSLEEWTRAVREILAAIERGEVTKAVLARTLDLVPERPLDPVAVLEHLRAENRGTHVFFFEPEPGRVLLGAAPETIATVQDGGFHATAVAGTVAHGDSAAEQRGLARRLLASAKDRAEHGIALDDMIARLSRLADDVEAETEPHVLTLTRMQHLETRIRATLPPGVDVLEALHPTAAVCGLPRDQALALLAREEPFVRGWYAGPVGWFDAGGNGVFAPALRTAVVADGVWRLFAGAGIVSGSDPQAEWEETGMKFQPVLRALAAAGAR
ncbi:MAG: isochorismate synthase [Gemmatimonadetes bacterium]|nr:MAG: isochorismate synthase [Gemmatimonadota bacterium]